MPRREILQNLLRPCPGILRMDAVDSILMNLSSIIGHWGHAQVWNVLEIAKAMPRHWTSGVMLPWNWNPPSPHAFYLECLGPLECPSILCHVDATFQYCGRAKFTDGTKYMVASWEGQVGREGQVQRANFCHILLGIVSQRVDSWNWIK